MHSIRSSRQLCLTAAFGAFLVTASCSTPDNPTKPETGPSAEIIARQLAVTVTELGDLGGNFSQARSINAAGQVAGVSLAADGVLHAFFWERGTMRDLGRYAGGRYGSSNVALNNAGRVAFTSVVGADTHAVVWDGAVLHDLGTLGGNYSDAVAINAAGHVVGFSRVANGGPFEFHAFLWDGTTMRDLGVVGRAIAINAGGFVAGNIGFSRAFVWDGTTVTDIGTLGGFTSVRGINEQGGVVGCSAVGTSFVSHAFLWDGATMRDLGARGGDGWLGDPSRWSSCAIAINARGTVLGTTSGDLAADQAAWVWDGATTRVLGTLGGRDAIPQGMNERGHVVGSSDSQGSCSDRVNRTCHAFFWDGSTMHDLGSIGNGPSSALAINQRGEIVGWAAADVDGAPQRAVLWTVRGRN